MTTNLSFLNELQFKDTFCTFIQCIRTQTSKFERVAKLLRKEAVGIQRKWSTKNRKMDKLKNAAIEGSLAQFFDKLHSFAKTEMHLLELG